MYNKDVCTYVFEIEVTKNENCFYGLLSRSLVYYKRYIKLKLC